MLFFRTFYSSKNPEKDGLKILSITTVFIDDNKKCYLSSKSAYFNYLKYKFGFIVPGINCILKYIQIENILIVIIIHNSTSSFVSRLGLKCLQSALM